MYEEYARLRDAIGATDYSIGKALNIPFSSLSHWKLGKRKLSMENMRKLASYFDVSIEQLLGDDPLDDAVEDVRSLADRLIDVSDEAVQIARLYDRADAKSRAITRLALDYAM